ncbi:hypothetical protein SLNSH_20505 [Alsobacter soli]|uniref:Glycosyltransferase subfamily 4-like N-terminal domain-containing protein n=1 Tax=Alsobacter soli TaxID=2109933 RepID=A0A2T1HN83_9HYPH|nr:glycosyltransferase [Alsobacter soli]PSC03115.1 hypothetical protein SLNSH_20505 [Alsobacter soli]
MKVAYFVHDLADAAVRKRVAMFRAAGASITLFGFRRTPAAPSEVAGLKTVDLGQTLDGRLGHRAMAVARRLLDHRSWAGALAGHDVFMARQLEMLPLAAQARARHAPGARLVYELLDVHRSMLAPGPRGAAMRLVERALLSRVDSIVVSSPAFEREYLARWQPRHPTTILVENKVFGAAAQEVKLVPGPATAPPWRIGWFGVIRCRRSLEALRRLALALPGQVEIDIRGVRANTELGPFDDIVSATPGLRFHGRYQSPEDLAAIYGQVHFTWAIDFFEAGLNSTWLLPNRLYEGGLHGVPSIALDGVETAAWLQARQAGLMLKEPLEETLIAAMAGMTPDRYQELRRGAEAIPRAAVLADEAECRRMLERLASARRR